VFRQLDEGRADRLVVDVRHNVGGNSEVDDPLMEGLQRRAAARQRGRFFALIASETFSSGMWTAVDLRNLGAVLVGSPSGGKPNSYGDVRTFVLPNSRIEVGYSTKLFRLIEGSDPASVMPDLLVEPSIDDLREGRDPLLEAAVRFPR
jgi:C-terminal processing protease CtpA/Prc